MKLSNFHTLTFKITLLGAFLFFSCNYITYTPHSKKQEQFAKPPVSLIEYIIEYREIYGKWPLSKEDFIYKNLKYKEAFADFPYLFTQFKIKDEDNMTFYFGDHIKDVERKGESTAVDLNSYGGEIKFYKVDGKFVWKTKMY